MNERISFSHSNHVLLIPPNLSLQAFVAEQIEDKPHKRNSVRLAIRKIMYAPSKIGEQPSIEVSKEFMLKPNKIHLEASLDKEVSPLNAYLMEFHAINQYIPSSK